MEISFKPYHGTPFQHFRINRVYPDGKIKRIGKMLAPTAALALAKAIELWNQEPDGCVLMVETPEQAQARFMASRGTGKRKKKKR